METIPYPRQHIQQAIQQRNLEELLHTAAAIHGHYCTGLAMGVVAGRELVSRIGASADGLEDLLVITETNNCASDGVQVVTGCTFGNNGLIFRETGKIAFTIVNRGKAAFRIVVRPDAREFLRTKYAEFSDSYQKVIVNQSRDEATVEEFKIHGYHKAMVTIKQPFEQLFTIQKTEIPDLPDFAKATETVICSMCQEPVMENHTVEINQDFVCFSCSNSEIRELNGNGMK
ncbi:MAG: hypothetical protein KKD31_14440 [Bacteroidetes bacterium]|nr:hypothetical protein [Bacteroidota bacterium]